MIGPLLATSIASMLGWPTRSLGPFRNAGQWIIGSALGLYFTPQVTALVASLWWAIALAIAWALGLGWAFGRWLDRGHAGRMGESREQQRATSYFAGAIGGASEMTLLAERYGARTDLVAAAHSLRLLVVTLSVPLRSDPDRPAWPGRDAARAARGELAGPGLACHRHGRRRPRHATHGASQSMVHGRPAGRHGIDDDERGTLRHAQVADQRGPAC